MKIGKRAVISAVVKVAAAVTVSSAPFYAATAATSPAPAEQSIPFVNHGGIYNWEADKDRGVWVQDSHRRWFYARVMGPCPGLNFTERLGFDTRPMGSLDRFSSLIVPGWGRCQLQSLLPSEGPPKKVKPQAKQPAPEPAAVEDKQAT